MCLLLNYWCWDSHVCPIKMEQDSQCYQTLYICRLVPTRLCLWWMVVFISVLLFQATDSYNRCIIVFSSGGSFVSPTVTTLLCTVFLPSPIPSFIFVYLLKALAVPYMNMYDLITFTYLMRNFIYPHENWSIGVENVCVLY